MGPYSSQPLLFEAGQQLPRHVGRFHPTRHDPEMHKGWILGVQLAWDRVWVHVKGHDHLLKNSEAGVELDMTPRCTKAGLRIQQGCQ